MFCLVFSAIFSKEISGHYESDVTFVSNVFLDIIDKFLTRNEIKFNFRLFGLVSSFQRGVLNSLMPRINFSFPCRVYLNKMEPQIS